MNKYADMIVEENPRAGVYLEIMNHYLVENNMQPLKPYPTAHSKLAQHRSPSVTQESVEMPFSLSTPPSLPPSPISHAQNVNPSTSIAQNHTNSSTPTMQPQPHSFTPSSMPITNPRNSSDSQDVINSPVSSQSNCDSLSSIDKDDLIPVSTNSEESDSEVNLTVVSTKTANTHTQSLSDLSLITPYQHQSESPKKTKKRKKKFKNLTLSDRVLRSGAESEPEAEVIRDSISGSIQSSINSIIDEELNKQSIS